MLRGSVSTMDGEMEGNRGRRMQMLHDTRVSSGVSPES